MSGSYDKTIRIWDFKTGEELAKLTGHDNRVFRVQFDDFKIVSSAQLLGFYLGPTAAVMQWAAPLGKFSERVDSIASAGASVSITSYSYNVRAVPVLMYKAQLVPLPENAAMVERNALHKIMKLARSSLRDADFYNLEDSGGPRLKTNLIHHPAALYTPEPQRQWCALIPSGGASVPFLMQHTRWQCAACACMPRHATAHVCSTAAPCRATCIACLSTPANTLR